MYATLPGWPPGASHSHNIMYYSPTADSPPSKKETPRWRVLYRTTRQLLHRVSTASFESCRVHASTGISGCSSQAQSTYFTVRGQSYFSRLPKYRPPPLRWGRTDSPGGEGGGGSIFWKTREIGLPSYSKICTLCSQAKLKSCWDLPPWSIQLYTEEKIPSKNIEAVKR